jgi:thiosulfate reductase/polysulfide reductase chain A
LGKGVADQKLMPGGIEKWDPAGGAIAMQEHFVAIRRL